MTASEWQREQTERMIELSHSSTRRSRAVPTWVRSVYTETPCTMPPQKEVVMLAEFLGRFGGIFS